MSPLRSILIRQVYDIECLLCKPDWVGASQRGIATGFAIQVPMLYKVARHHETITDANDPWDVTSLHM